MDDNKKICNHCETGYMYLGSFGWYCLDCDTFEPTGETDELAERFLDGDKSLEAELDRRSEITQQQVLAKVVWNQPDNQADVTVTEINNASEARLFYGTAVFTCSGIPTPLPWYVRSCWKPRDLDGRYLVEVYDEVLEFWEEHQTAIWRILKRAGFDDPGLPPDELLETLLENSQH